MGHIVSGYFKGLGNY